MEKHLFVREATGLVREISPLATFAVALSGIGIISIFGFYTSFLTATPNDNPFIAFLIIAPTVIALTAVYSLLTAAFPRSGADYVYNTRILNPAIGVMTDFLYMSALAGTLPSLGILAINEIQDMLKLETLTTGNQAYAAAATTLGQPLVQLLLATVMVVVTMFFILGRLRTFMRLALIVVIVNILAFFLVIGLVASTPSARYETLFGDMFHVDYQTIISTAKSAGLSSASGSGIGWYGTSTLIYWVTGAFLPTFVAGEMKKPGKTLVAATVSAQIVMILFYALAGVAAFGTFGAGFIDAESYLVAHGMVPFPTTTGNLLYLMAPVIGSPLLIAFVFISIALSGFFLGALTTGLSNRKLFAWAFDRLIPSKFADISGRFQTPVFASIVIGIIAEIYLVLVIFGPGLYEVVGGLGVLLLSVVWGVSAISAIVLPFRRHLFEGAPSFVRAKIGPVPLISVLGAFLLVSLEAFLIMGQLIPTIQGGLPIYPTLWTISTMVGGLLLYFAAKAYRKREYGLDISLVYKEIPPE